MEATQRGDERIPLGVEPGELDGTLDGVGAVVDEEGVLQVARRDHGEQLGQCGAPGLQQLLAVERHPPHLVGHRFDDLRVVDSRAEDAVPAEAVDILPAQQVLEEGAAAGPFDRGELPRLRDRLAIGDEPTVDVPLVRLHRLADERLLLLERHLAAGDEVEVPAGLL